MAASLLSGIAEGFLGGTSDLGNGLGSGLGSMGSGLGSTGSELGSTGSRVLSNIDLPDCWLDPTKAVALDESLSGLVVLGIGASTGISRLSSGIQGWVSSSSLQGSAP